MNDNATSGHDILLAPESEQRGDWRGYFESMAPEWNRWRRRARGYHRQINRYLAYCVPRGSRVLEVGCATGETLSALEPSYGVGIDYSKTMIDIARTNHPHLTFVHSSIEEFETNETFDYIILESLVGSLADVEYTFNRLRRFCTPETRIIFNYHNSLLEPLYGVAETLGLRKKQPTLNWISTAQIRNLLRLSGFNLIRIDSRHFFPFGVPLVEQLVDRFIGRLPLLRNASLMFWGVARCIDKPRIEKPTVSVICPCRNEAGNIRDAVTRLPQMGGGTELIFVEGNSTDDTYEQCEKVLAEFPDKDLSLYKQEGKGKGDAVRKGFAAAKGDILMILDADLTVPPEDLPKFYKAIALERGEYINGTRLVYPMEKQAMRFLNKLGNKFFSILFTWILGQPITDTLCGTKVLWKKDYERLAANRAYFGEFDPFGDFDLIFGSSKMGYELVEVPVRYRDRTYGSTNISRFRHGVMLLRMSALAMMKIRFH